MTVLTPRPIWLALALPALTLIATDVRADDGRINFDRQVRPILADKCFACHGPDAEARQSELRLDVREDALKPAESGRAAIVPGKPDESPLVRKISNPTAKGRMPPLKTGKTLSTAEIAILRDWVAQGAEYTTHWSFRAPEAASPPAAKPGAWSRNPIDRFLLAKMEKEGLSPSATADKPTLIRRLTLDLTGLPPTIAEVDAFLADDRPDAYERQVDRLMASPRYGEKMAIDWLDAARFADTHGYHIDSGRDMSRWRAWVIDSFNKNKPYDQFTVEQVAGDLLPNATLDQKIASGFNRNHMINFEGGAVPEEYHTAYIVDRVNTTGTVFLGLTVGCAQCHDHKFDPLKQKEYYRFYAFFHNVPENGLDGSKGNAAPTIPAPSSEQSAELAGLDAKLADLRSRLIAADPKADAAQAEWERRAVVESDWRTPKVLSTEASGGATLSAKDDGLIVADGAVPAKDTFKIVLAPDGRAVTGIRLELLPDDRYPNKGPGRSVNGNVVLTRVRFESAEPGKTPKPLAVRSAASDFHQDNFPIQNVLDDQDETGWAILPETGKRHEARFTLAETFENKEGGPKLLVTLEFQSQFAAHEPGRFRLATTSSAEPSGPSALPANVRDALAVAVEKRTDDQTHLIRDHYRTIESPEFRAVAAERASLAKRRGEVEASIPTAMIMSEMPKPRDTFVLMRGQYDKKGEQVTAEVPAFLPPLPQDAPRNRLGLARWLVDPKHPLTSRVAVNRLWQSIFGVGLVKTSEDFGTQGDAPSHPELLDWLAVEFASPKEGTPWDVKRMVRLMVTSEAYRQRSAVTPEKLTADPENRLLSRSTRLRLPAESLRDQALFAGGILKEKIGGPSVSPYNPPGLWEELMSRADGKNWSAQTYTQSHGDDLYRRTMYTYWKRTCPPPSLATFDAPDRETCTVRRARTNTPLQALVMLNDPTYVEASRKMAERILKEGGVTVDERVAFAFRLATSRTPSAEEATVLKKVFEAEKATFRADPTKAAKLLSVGELARDEGLDMMEVAAWSAVASVVLNLDEVVTRG